MNVEIIKKVVDVRAVVEGDSKKGMYYMVDTDEDGKYFRVRGRRIICDGKYLHAIDIDIGMDVKPFIVKGAVLMNRKTNCYYPESEGLFELVDGKTRKFKEMI